MEGRHYPLSLQPSAPRETTIPLTKPPRKQVSRACEGCRVRRVRCDNSSPCRHCRSRGIDCTKRRTDEVRTLPQALSEIERLRSQVADLHAQLRRGQEDTRLSSGPGTPGAFPTPENSAVGPETLRSDAACKLSAGSSGNVPPWEGIHVATARSEQTSYYGPASTVYFLSRIGSYLASALHEPIVNRSMQLQGASTAFSSLATSTQDPQDVSPTRAAGHRPEQPKCKPFFLPRAQEEYFIGFFWETYHCLLPMIDEEEFRRHYVSLWADASGIARKPSPLVDIILALCMQYGLAFLPRGGTAKSIVDTAGPFRDPQIAGKWYYRRCQSLLALEIESPSLTVVQCHVLSAVYLCCASFQNTAHSTLALAVRAAQILGLHIDPPADVSDSEKELRRRVWWCLYTIETKMSIKVGRPFVGLDWGASVAPPSDSPEAASLLGGNLGTYGSDVSWLTYSVQFQRLILASRDVYCALHSEISAVLWKKGAKTPYADPQAMEYCAEFLSSRKGPLLDWIAQVPKGLTIPRSNDSSAPFSTDRTAVRLNTDAPLWLQRQQISLELSYHIMCMNLYRLFIIFSSHTSNHGVTYSPIVEKHATTAVRHAMIHTQIMYQVLSETDILNGWLEGFQWQWNATVTILGFIIAYPVGPSTSPARKSIEKVTEIFEIFKENFAVAASAAMLTRNLVEKADILTDRFREGLMGSPSSMPVFSPAGDTTKSNSVSTVSDNSVGGGMEPSLTTAEDILGSGFYSDFIDSALSVDAFSSFEEFYGDGFNLSSSIDLTTLPNHYR